MEDESLPLPFWLDIQSASTRHLPSSMFLCGCGRSRMGSHVYTSLFVLFVLLLPHGEKTGGPLLVTAMESLPEKA